MKRTLPRFISAYADRHGKVRYRFRRTGQRPYSFKSQVGTPAFLNEYHACLAGNVAPYIVVGHGRSVEGSFDDLISRFYRSTDWVTPAESSKSTYRGIIERFRAQHGHRMVAEMEFEHVDRILAQMAGTPAAANNLRKVLSRLMEYAVRIRMAGRNPVRGVRKFKTNPEGWHPWTDDEIAKFEQRHALGTKARLAFALLLYTGQRRSDVVRIGRQHISKNKISLTQEKTGTKLVLPVHSHLSAAIAAMPRHEHLTFLVTSFGKPFTAAGFGNWFRDRCDEAGLPNCSAHGLRKAFTRRLVYAGLTHAQGKALTGHLTDAEFNRYARHANQEQLAEEGMANLEARLAKNDKKILKIKQKK